MIDIRQVPLTRLVQILNWYNGQPMCASKPLATLYDLITVLNTWSMHLQVLTDLKQACHPVLPDLQASLVSHGHILSETPMSAETLISALTRYFMERTLLHATLFDILVAKRPKAILDPSTVSELYFLASNSPGT